jgi:hypothetical protein
METSMKRINFRSVYVAARIAAAAALALGGLTAAAGAKAPPKILVFDTVFIDRMASGMGDKFTEPADYDMARTVSATLRKTLAERKTYQVVKTPAEAAGDISAGAEDQGPDISCASCVLELAKKHGAEFILTSAVTRFSGAAVYFKMELDEVATGKAVGAISSQISGFNQTSLSQAALDGLKKFSQGDQAAGPAKGDAKSD